MSCSCSLPSNTLEKERRMCGCKKHQLGEKGRVLPPSQNKWKTPPQGGQEKGGSLENLGLCVPCMNYGTGCPGTAW